MPDIDEIATFQRSRIESRQINELIGLAHGIIADGQINQTEVEYLQAWLTQNQPTTGNEIIVRLRQKVDAILADGELDDDEASAIFSWLHGLVGGDFELGECGKSSTLPLCDPPPVITFDDKWFCFTGSFSIGTRRDCEKLVNQRGAAAGNLTQKTSYLVIGEYVTESWAHSSFGRKIEKAMEFRTNGIPIGIVSERHWSAALEL